MKNGHRPTEELLVGRRELDDVPGYELLGDLVWQRDARCWALHFRLCVPVPPDEVRDHDVPETTDWYALIEPEYPAGELSIRPASQGGLAETYPHQTRNLPPRAGEPWRDGVVCVATPARGFGRHTLDAEPHHAADRLRWHVDRTRSWIEAARRGELLRGGEPFELPIYATLERPWVIFDTAAADLSRWEVQPDRFGYATLRESRSNPRLRVLSSFTGMDPDGPAQINAEWGSLLGGPIDPGLRHRAIWLRVDTFPVLKPWRAPETWAELTESLATGGVNLMDILHRLAPGLRDEKQHFLLIGAPIPIHVGEPPVLMHWIALQMPELSTLAKPRKGFRAGEDGAWRRDQAEVLRPERSLVWIPTQNWSPDEIATRGRAAPTLRDARIVLIGAGAMGSALAELLVREGAGGALTILDGETLAVGNLVRHSLTLAEVGAYKASALAHRLNAVNAYARVVGVDLEFPGDARGREALATADLVIETTGSDALLSQLQEYEWVGSRLFVSASIGFYARRLFLFCARGACFPLRDYAAAVDPWLLQERVEIDGHEMPWEGTGCWHPVFPARASDFAMLAGVALRQIEAGMGTREGAHVLHVTERTENATGDIELRRAALAVETQA